MYAVSDSLLPSPTYTAVINLNPPHHHHTITTTITTPVDNAITPVPKPLVEVPDSDRPERMRDWLVRMINSGQFPGLKWIDEEKMIFRVPWIHAKKRDYNQERDAALFREWAIHSGKLWGYQFSQYLRDHWRLLWRFIAIAGDKGLLEIIGDY